MESVTNPETVMSSCHIIEQTFYEPFGKITDGGTTDMKLYTGQFKDDITNQYYYVSRYYNPAWGRFTQADDLIPDVYNPQSLNRYAYVLNNPYKYTDEDGHYAIPVIAGVGGFFAGAIGYWASTPIDRDNPQWDKRLGLGLLSGLNIGANSALIASGSLTSAGGAIRFAGGSGLATFGRTTAYTGLGSTSMQLYHSLITQERISGADYATNLAIDIATGNTQVYRMGGQFAPVSSLDTRNGIKFAVNYFAQTSFATASQGFLNLLQQLNVDLNSNNANQAGNSQSSQGRSSGGGGGGYVPRRGYVTDDGRTYPTNNPNFRPNPNTPRVCVSGC